MGDKAAREVRRQRQTSLFICTELVKTGAADAMVSLGNTGAAMATALVVLGRIPGVERPALAGVFPVPAGSVLLLDIGANADARVSHLHQFAHLGNVYMNTVHGIEAPRVALLSIGEEPTKGSSLVLEAHALLASDETLRFIGNVESGEILRGQADVIVTDGFTGNICLKLAEGMLQMLFGEMRRVAGSSLRARAGGALLLPALREVRDRLDYRSYGAAPLLGVAGCVFIGHGRSDPSAVANAIRSAHHAAERNLLVAMAEAIRATGTERRSGA
jgi:glycerol-3-phosphate acyltransferase PlsX